jgi:hypothetical protein
LVFTTRTSVTHYVSRITFHASRFTFHAMRDDTLRQIPPLLPQFLRKRRVGMAGLQEEIERLGVDRPTFLIVRMLHELQGSYGGKPVTLAQMRAREPYSAVDHVPEPVGILEEKGLLLRVGDGAYTLSDEAREAVERVHELGRAHVARLQPLPPEELEALAHELHRALVPMLNDPVLAPRAGSHLAGSHSLAVFGDDAPAMVRIEQGIFDLWMARDDAHIKAWRDAGMEGPPMAVLTTIWYGDAHAVGELQQALANDQTPADLESSLAYLLEKEYITRDGDDAALTDQGILAREDIEHETDRIYFAPWPHIETEAEWLRDRLQALVSNL